MKRILSAVALSLLLLALSALSCAQSAPALFETVTGTPPFGSFGGGPFDVLNLANLNAHFQIPIVQKAGRGAPFVFNLTYDSSAWYIASVSGVATWQPQANYGWNSFVPTYAFGNFASKIVADYMQPCNPGAGNFTPVHIQIYSMFAYYDTKGTPHPFAGSTSNYPGIGGCIISAPPVTLTGEVAVDGSGYVATISEQTASSLQDANGKSINLYTTTLFTTDANGNQVTSSNGVYTDTLGQTALTISGTSPVLLQYTAPSGATAQYTVNYTSYNIETNFGCSGITEFNASGATNNIPLISSIVTPDGSSYSFTYEQTPGHTGFYTGRLAKVTLNTGASISYSYTGSNDGVACADGSTMNLTRTVTPVNGTAGTWTYARTNPSSNQWTTTITSPPDPVNAGSASDVTVIDFAQDGAGTSLSPDFYETDRKAYQGAAGGTLLRETQNCWNNNLGTCPGQAVSSPITQLDSYTFLPNGKKNQVETVFNGYGLPTDQKQYDWGTTPTLVQDTATTYASLSNGIVDRPASVATTDASGNLLSKTTYSYDQTTPTTTSGTPQLVPISGNRGNLTTENIYTTSTATLTKTITYYDTGTPNTSTDVNGAVTTYIYGTAAQGTSTISCGNSFPTTINLPVSGLSTSMSWNCIGGVQTGTTDLNGHSTSVTYTDAHYWRPANSIDQASSQTNYSYKNPLKTETYMTFNGTTSIVDQLIMTDGLGRILTSQKRQSQTSNNYDTVETTYDAMGRASTVTAPYQGTVYQLTTTTPVITTTYDALNRVTQTEDANAGYVQHTFTNNDDLQITGPAPTGENTKQRQMEYDGLGRLTSVCEVTQGMYHVACAQSNGLNGFYTSYAYSFASPNVKVLVTQAAQSRTYLYDLGGRMVSETNPENATTMYDFDSGPDCSGTYNGDLVERKDAKGNISCYTYDALHRVSSVNYSGPDSANTPAKNFVYDSATVNSVTMANTKGQLAEAYTGASGSKITDEGFSYSVVGQVTDVYEMTPHSGTYYHPTAAYWNNGALKTAWISSLPSISYGADGEGRTSTVSASSGQNPITATVYNVASQATSVTFGSADSDSYSFDPNSGRQTQYKFNVNTQSVTGNTTWNPNGSLQQLAITNALNSLDTQTCNYAHDDVARIESVDCGAAKWQQNFAYDVYGNIAKTVPTGGTGIAFQAGYTASSNWITSLPGITPTTDADGRMTYDGTHNYAWDVEGKMVTVDTTSLTHDALGRLVEKNVSGTITEFVYGPIGSKFAQMSGATLQKAFVPLPTGTAVYTGSGLAYYRHTDHLGSSRFATTPTRTMYSSTAYAPYGEPYAQAGTTDLSYAGHDQDTIAGIHDALDRKFVPVQGRWLSPDPAGLSAVDMTNPQSWNRYAYVNNNPLAMVDPFGDDGCYDPGGNQLFVAAEECYSAGGFWFGNGEYVSNGNVYQLQSQISYEDVGTTMFGVTHETITAGLTDTSVLLGAFGNFIGFQGQLFLATLNNNSNTGPVGSPNNSGASSSDPPCKVGNCSFTIYPTPQTPIPNACAGAHNEKGQEASFVSLWDCVGSKSDCEKNQHFYTDSCVDSGNVPMACGYACFMQASCVYTCQCCNYH